MPPAIAETLLGHHGGGKVPDAVVDLHYDLALLHVNIQVLPVDAVAVNEGSRTAPGPHFEGNLKLQSDIEGLI